MNHTKHSPHLASPKGRGITSRAFTLVELIVVVTILAILATIGFVSYSSYLTGVRDTNRLAQLVSIHDGLELYRTKKDLPLPDESVEIQANGVNISYQGYAGSNVLETIDFTKGGVDPKDNTYFSYYLTDDRKYFQLMAFLEEKNDIIGQSDFIFSAQAIDYSDRIPTIYGDKLGILTNSENIPIQEISVVSNAGFIVFDGSGLEYTAHLASGEIIIGNSENMVSGAVSNMAGRNYESCNDILINRLDAPKVDGIYWINKDGTENSKVYCDMSTDGGGWTLFAFNGGEPGSGVPAAGTQNFGVLDKQSSADMDIRDLDFNGIMAYHFGNSDYILFDMLDIKLLKEELLDVTGETSAGGAQTDLGTSIHKADVNGVAYSSNISITIFEIHRAHWDPSNLSNWILEGGSRGVGNNVLNKFGFSKAGGTFKDNDLNNINAPGDYGLFIR